MKVATIEVPVEQAKKALLDYRQAVKGRHTVEDEAIMAGYRALATGKSVINIQDALATGGVDEAGLPKLAVARSDALWVYLDHSIRWRGDDREVDWFRFLADSSANWRRRAARDTLTWLSVPEGTPPPELSLRTQVPIVPPALRPRGSLVRYYTLFEVEEWSRVVPAPPRDPLLLRRLRGDLFAVMAAWDLTELERTVIGSRQ